MSMSSKSQPPILPVVVWNRIIAFLYRPLPRPTGRNSRSSIRQGDLVTMMRVDKLSNRIAAPYLYKVMVTDHLPSLITNLDTPGVKGVKSKAQLLQSTERLFIEYCEKFDLTYPDIMLGGGAFFDLASFRPNNLDICAVCRAEAQWLYDAVVKLEALKAGYPLHSLSTGAFLGGQFGVWELVSRVQHPSRLDLLTVVDRAALAVTRLAIHPGRMSYYCQRVEYGPLRYMPIGPNTDPPHPKWNGAQRIEHRAHIDMKPGHIPSALGGNSIWYCAYPTIENPLHICSQGGFLGECISENIRLREKQVAQLSRRQIGELGDRLNMSVDIYLPPIMRDERATRFMNHALKEAITAGYAGLRTPIWKYKDAWRWKKIEEAPVCDACGWTSDDIPDSEPIVDTFSLAEDP